MREKIVEEEKKTSKNEYLSFFLETLKTIAFIAVAFVFVRYYLVQPFLVVGTSMEPSFHDGEYILVNEISYHFFVPKRGEVVIFKHPDKECTESVENSYINRIFLQGPCKNYIKRVVGLPGETVEIKDGAITVYNDKNPSGEKLSENYTADIKLFGNQKVTLEKDEYYVVGDNRLPNGSSDSREWGPLKREFITGKAALVVLPLQNLGLVRAPSYSN
ncbi:MAG: signal peptidase I [Patescibacteria group bacterium]|nr:signal peptidase I [Patescibacteria group bacterium]MCL5094205.1 signal peptidase I [Patescibacteria group bacterium]